LKYKDIIFSPHCGNFGAWEPWREGRHSLNLGDQSSGNRRQSAQLISVGQSDQAAAGEVFMGNVADSIAVKILLGVATAAVWFALSHAASAYEVSGGPSATERVPAAGVDDRLLRIAPRNLSDLFGAGCAPREACGLIESAFGRDAV
jgi:hypothetical protein